MRERPSAGVMLDLVCDLVRFSFCRVGDYRRCGESFRTSATVHPNVACRVDVSLSPGWGYAALASALLSERSSVDQTRKKTGLVVPARKEPEHVLEEEGSVGWGLFYARSQSS
jgi:hypothetical protein